MTGPDERPSRLGSGRGTGQLLVYASVTLAVAAAAVLALSSDDVRLLRLGIIAALWAALAGAFAAARIRRDVTSAAGKAEDLREIYQLELEREVAARREHELTVERDLRRDIERDSRAELDALRAEVRTLRANLEAALGGDLMLERVALHAESTRLRSLTDQGTDRAALRPVLTAPSNGGRATAGLMPRRGREEPGGSGRFGRSGPWQGPAVQPHRDPVAQDEPSRHSRPEPPPPPPPQPQRSRPEPPPQPQRSRPEPPPQPQRSRPEPPPQPQHSRPEPSPQRPGDDEDPLFGELPWYSEPDPTPDWQLSGNGNGPSGNGAHAGGRSVQELLSAHGAMPAPRRRRRREED